MRSGLPNRLYDAPCERLEARTRAISLALTNHILGGRKSFIPSGA